MLNLKNSFIEKISKIKREDNESGVALIAVILVMMLLLMTTILISLTVMSTQSQTKEFGMNQQARATADSGMNSFLASVNTSTGYRMLETYKTSSTQGGEAQKTTPSNALCKTIETSVNVQIGYYPRWCAWTVKVSSGTGSTGYYIYTKGFTVPTQSSALRSNPKDEVVIRVFVEPVVVSTKTTLEDGKVVYEMPASSPFQLGITGSESITVANGAKIYSNQFSMNSSPTGTDTKSVALASDSLIGLPNNFVVGALSAPSTKTVAEICTPVGSSACNDPIHRSAPVTASMASIKTDVDTACPNAANSYPSWTASEHGTSTIPAGCYNQIVIDRDMMVPATFNAANPLKVYAKGSVSIMSSVDVGLNRDPAAFQLRSIGSVIWNNKSGVAANTTIIKNTNAYIASASSCTTTNNTTRRLSLNGALACYTTVIGANTTVYMDTKSQQYGIEVIGGAPSNSVWFATGIEQL